MGEGVWDVDFDPTIFFLPSSPRPCSLRCDRSANATGCPVHARCARVGCGCPRCVLWATCCAIASTAPPASFTATGVTTALRGLSCCAWSQKTPRTSHPPLTTLSTSRNRPTSAHTAGAWEQSAQPGVLAIARLPRWTAASCCAVAGVTARARSASPSVATAPSIGAATSAAATARIRASCTSVYEAPRLRKLSSVLSPLTNSLVL